MTEQIMTGTLDLGISPAPLVGKAFCIQLPFQFDDRDHIKRVCDSDTAKELLAVFTIQWLAFHGLCGKWVPPNHQQ